jgi:excisionase family DNA binding protein
MYLRDNPLATDRTPINRKLVGPAAGGGNKVYVDFKTRPFQLLEDLDLVDTADLCRMFGCSARTVYRWVAEHGLRPTMRVGRELLFTKREVVRWYDANRPRLGRPPAKRR